MKKILLFITMAAGLVQSYGQFVSSPGRDDNWRKTYRAAETKINSLVHTKLDARFDYDKSYLYGKAWLTLEPHFYPTDSLRLDAKGMDIKKVSLFNAGKTKDLAYKYADNFLDITLDKVYKKGQRYTVHIEYTAKPNEFKTKGSAAINDAKGLYFINPKGEDKNKPTQIWTQGETEATSVWCPTIDRPNQKTTQEFILTVPSKYVSLSNGLLTSQKKNADGTRTDTWKMDLPHAPYLFFIGIGDYAVVKDKYKGKEVSYYVEKEYEAVARKIFGLTPEMIKCFEQLTGVPYPWSKYAQMTARDYVSGAMENTTATLHQESAQQNARELMDGNGWESTIAHELFHQWFGDLVTAESWSNLTVNESFANYSQVLWNEYKYGADAAAEENLNDMQSYLSSGSRSSTRDLVRFYYADKEDMFDLVSYNKGGRILHMLRNYLGDSAFFKGLNVFLTANKFKAAEAHQLRLAFEEVSGKDLNWFFNQWYFGNSHPKLEISYNYDESAKIAKVMIKQTQSGDKIFKLPFAIDVYEKNSKKRHMVWVENKIDSFQFAVSGKPDLINVDGDKILLADKKESKTLAEYIHQYHFAGNFVDRKEALDFAGKNSDKPEANALFKAALNDKYFKLRERALRGLKVDKADATTIATILNIAKTDAHRTTRAAAIDALAGMRIKENKDFYVAAAKDSSYSVAGAALEALLNIDEAKAIELLPELKKDAKDRLSNAIQLVEVLTRSADDFDKVTKEFDDLNPFEKLNKYKNYLTFLGKVEDIVNFKKGVDKIVAFRNQITPFAPQFKDVVNQGLMELRKKKLDAKIDINAYQIDQQVAYINEKLKD
jgi:aminopeptidase N